MNEKRDEKYVEMKREAREIALKRMTENAEEMGADAVVNLQSFFPYRFAFHLHCFFR